MKTLFNIGDKITAGDIASYIFDTIRPVVGYSLRKLSNISGPVIRARRGIDNKESDFYADEIEGGELQSFATGDGASDVYVTTWYDQFGNNNATQTSASNQPKIWDASTGLVTENGKPAVDFTTNDAVLRGLLSIGSSITFFATGRIPADTLEALFELHQSGSNRFIVRANSGAYEVFDQFSSGTYSNNQILFSAHITASASDAMYINGANTETGSFSKLTTTDIAIGNDNTLSDSSIVQELIIYNTDQSANKETIETNVNQYYIIFGPLRYNQRITEDSGTFALTDRYEAVYDEVTEIAAPSLLCTCDAYKGSSLTTYGTLYNIIPA